VSNPSQSQDAATPSSGLTQEPEPIDLLGYLKGLARHWLAGLITAIVVAGLAFGAGSLSGSGTEAVGTVWSRAHVMMTMPAAANEGQAVMMSEATTRIINSYVAVQDSDTLIKDTTAALGDGTNESTVKSATSIFWGGGGQVIAFYALGRDEAEAQKRADAYAQAFIKDSPSLLPAAVAGTSVPTFTLVQKAFPSTASPDPQAAVTGSSAKLLGSPVVDVLAGVIVGLLVMAGLEMRAARRQRLA